MLTTKDVLDGFINVEFRPHGWPWVKAIYELLCISCWRWYRGIVTP